MSQANYKGLSNIGATCYINSFLQTLFMTPEFRQGIYEWKYNQKTHAKKEDSILFQLQKLFAKLQLGYTSISTKELVKSFQWHEDEANNQQDIQQFNRVLFEALQKSLSIGKDTNRPFIKQLYEGELAHFTKCLECHNQSVRDEIFQDLILIIKNVYEKVYNTCIELSLQRYIKPQLLDQDNLYDCSVCNKKVRAQRGVKFIKLPKLLNVVLQRFHFDYMTMTRNKINDKFTFPHILNFNHYFNGYEQIPIKLSQDSSAFFLEDQAPKKVVRSKPPPIVAKKVISKTGTTASQPAVAGKVKTKPSANTKSFLQEMRRKKMHQQINENEDLLFISGNVVHQQKKQQVIKPTNIANHINDTIIQKVKENGKDNNLVQNDKPFDPTISGIPNHLLQIPPPPPLSILESLGTPTISECFNASSIVFKPQESIQQELQKRIEQKQLAKNEDKMKDLREQQQKNHRLIEQYLKDGPLVYELYSILVHSGTSNAGHYFSYIKSFENGSWYLFNDERVSEINVTEIQKTFGGNGLSSGYVLYYRLIDESKPKIESPIPEYILKIIQQEEQNFKIKQISKQINLQNTLILKVYFQLGVKTIQILKNSQLKLLFQKAKQMFNIKVWKNEESITITANDNQTHLREDNIRIRLFNPSNDAKLDTFTGKQQIQLQRLGIRSYQNFILEVKADSQEFDEFQPGFISIRIALWEQNMKLASLQQKNIRLHKVSINKLSLMDEVESVVKAKRSEFLKQQGIAVSENICIVKRHQNDEYLYHQIINLSDYYKKSVDTIGIFEGQILFVEPDSDDLNWPRQFQNEINKISVKIINANNLEQHVITTDSRIPLNQLKEQICGIINQPFEETIVRRGNRSGLEMKNGFASLKQNRFINGTTLFLEKGIPAKLGEIRIQLFLAEDASPQLYNRLHQFQFIADVPIDTNLKASEVKFQFANLLKKMKNLEINVENMRIRQKVNDKMGKIYRQKAMKQQQIIEKRQISIQLKEDKLQMKDYSIYVRVWDQSNWKLSQKYQFIVNKNTNMKDLAHHIHFQLKQAGEVNLISPEQMDLCRILSIHKFNIIDLVDMEYFGMMSEVSVLGEPMFVNSDGLLYIIKQTGIEPRELTKDEEIIFGGKIKTLTIRPTKGRTVVSNPQKKQKGITIKVVQKKQQQGNAVQ